MTKKEQLKIAFKNLLTKMLDDTFDDLCLDYPILANKYSNELLKEVTIRTNL